MIAFEISIDGQKICTAGVGDFGVISVLTRWERSVLRDPKSGETLAGRYYEELMLLVEGVAHYADGTSLHLEWLDRSLDVGQQVTLTVVNTTEYDTAPTRYREDSALVERRKREYYQRLKREYGDA